MWNLIEILLLSNISGNTSATAQVAALPEYAKEANFLTQGFFNEIRKKSRASRFYLNFGMTTVIGFLIWNHNGFRDSWWPVIVLLLSWAIITTYFKNSAMSKANKRAWDIISQKRMKEEIIRETMFEAASKRRQLAHQ
jgi:hypothetical protein